MKRSVSRSIFCLVSIVFVGFAQTASSDEAIWKDFLQWLNAQPPNSRPMDLLAPYRDEMMRKGVPPAEADRRMDLVFSLSFSRPEGVKLFWNKIYGGKNPIFVQTPTGLLVSAIEGRHRGKALDVGMGQGRNSVFLAMAGWDVTGFDPSDEGIRIAQENASKPGVKIHTVVARDEDFDYGKAQWDLIVMTYVRRLNEADAEKFWSALKPGGIVVYENGPTDNNGLLRAFLRYRIVRYENVEANADWNPDQQKTRVERLIAEKEVP
jgi:2-polyprenyl-3-methyl-5-hydroxy-6-metoxy-1,4-benzoquinol methylase